MGQEIIKAHYQTHQPGYYQEVILKSLEAPTSLPLEKKHFQADLSGHNFPTQTDQYQQLWHSAPHSQGNTGTCWCFSATSLLESEVYRINGKQLRLSEMYFVYWEYVERARSFVRDRGQTYFAQGSESNSVMRLIGEYGAVPYQAYKGLSARQNFHDHSQLFAEMETFLQQIKKNGYWNEDWAIESIRSILNKHLGTPPNQFEYQGSTYTPQSFCKQVMQIQPLDYFCFMSTQALPYNQKGELVEADNWWHSDDYYNVSLPDFMYLIDHALQSGFTVNLCGDVSEPGYNKWAEVGVVPAFDIPASHINATARQYRLENQSTTGDHCIQLVGIQDSKKAEWYLIKDSGSGAFDGPHKGYRFLHRDYIRLKMMSIMMHKDAARKILDQIIK